MNVMNLSQQIAAALERAKERAAQQQTKLSDRLAEQQLSGVTGTTPTPSRKKLEWE